IVLLFMKVSISRVHAHRGHRGRMVQDCKGTALEVHQLAWLNSSDSNCLRVWSETNDGKRLEIRRCTSFTRSTMLDQEMYHSEIKQVNTPRSSTLHLPRKPPLHRFQSVSPTRPGGLPCCLVLQKSP